MNSCGVISVVFVKSESGGVFSILRTIVVDGGPPKRWMSLLMSVKVCLAPFLSYRYSL